MSKHCLRRNHGHYNGSSRRKHRDKKAEREAYDARLPGGHQLKAPHPDCVLKKGKWIVQMVDL